VSVISQDLEIAGSAAVNPLLDRAIAALGKLPPFSPVLNRVLASLNQDNSTYAQLGELIEKDTVLSASILQLANSALYARSSTSTSVRHAAARLGMSKLTNAILGMSISRMWNQGQMPQSWSVGRFNVHSVATALLSDLIAQRRAVRFPEGAFVAGLLHDIGQLLIVRSIPEEYNRVAELSASTGRPPVECEMESLGFTHPELSARALAIWNLPEQARTAVRYHHSPALDPSELGPGEVPLSAVLDAANRYTNSIGISTVPVDASESGDTAPLEALGLDGVVQEKLLREFRAEYSAMEQFFR
jgi:HD-like signal output (HDOD) protein